MPHLHLVTIVVEHYDAAIAFYVDVLGFELVEDSPSLTTAGYPKRWVVVRPPGGETGILLAKADNDLQTAVIGKQTGGRVGFFLRVDNFKVTFDRLIEHGVEILRPPRDEPYGRVAVFADIAGNKWDLLGPVTQA
jgi:catechol 2,3-dioxygenase-like lactoylglutathione lyase family enzyme